ncbi:MAG: hypothetical protein KF882_01785 [Bacteroidia bacterium]|nr:hypothetical protein [Bacteroidia bacterium]MCO5253976.1 hypothetical protein [Bacteroidota bacterium]
MKTINLKLSLLFFLFYAFVMNHANADIVLKLETGIDQGMTDKYVTRVCDNTASPPYVSMTCLNSGNSKCYTNAELREWCEGANVVPWIPNVGTNGLDQTVTYIQSLFENGQSYGTINKTYYNPQTQETALVTFHWEADSTNPNIVIITIHDELL